MALLYRGNLKDVAKEVEEAAPHVNSAYERIFGKSRAQKLADMANRLLPAEAFLDTPEQWKSYLGDTLPAAASNKMGLATSSDIIIEPDGTIKRQKVRTSVVFYISEEGFRHSGSAEFTQKPVASYVHEFDHFIWYALQQKPIYLITLYLATKLGVHPPSDLESLCRGLTKQQFPPDQTIPKAILAIYNRTLTEVYEKSNRILDKLVLESIGIEVPLPWRHQARTYLDVPLPPNTIARIPTGGDIFGTLPDQEVIEKVLSWETTMQSPLHVPYVQNLERTVRDLKVSRVPITELLHDTHS